MSLDKNNIQLHDIFGDRYGKIQKEEVDEFRLRYRQPVTRIWKTNVLDNKHEIVFDEDIEIYPWVVVARIATMWALYKQGCEFKRPIYAFYNKKHLVIEQGIQRYWLSKLFNLRTPIIIVDHYASLSDIDDKNLESFNWIDVTSEYTISFSHKTDWYKGKDVLWPEIYAKNRKVTYNDKFDDQSEEEDFRDLIYEFLFNFEAQGKEYRFIYPDSNTHFLTPTKITSKSTYYVSHLGDMFKIILEDFN